MKKYPELNVDFHSTVKLSQNDKRKINQWLEWAKRSLKDYPFIHPKWLNVERIHLSILLCGEQKIKNLNAQHRNKDKVTDVLSFPAHQNLRKAPKMTDQFPDLFLGDLVICHQKVKTQASEFQISYMDEFIHLFIHGLLHLSGFDHEISRKEEVIMEECEKVLLDRFSKIKRRALSGPS